MKKLHYLCSLLFVITALFLISCEEAEPELLTLSNLVTGQEPPPEDCEIDHRTQTPGGWGAPAAGKNVGYIRDTYFDEAFPNGLTVGCATGYILSLTSATAVEAFLPSGGKPSALDQDYVDPTSKELKNVLAGHVVALTLNNNIDHLLEDFGEAEFLLCDLVLCSGEFAGKSVQQVLNQANKALGGCDSNLTVEEAIDILSSINENFVDGETDNGFLCCPGELKEPI